MDVKTMTLRLPAAQAQALDAVAQADEMPVSEAVRVAIEAHIEARRNDPAFQARLSKILDENRQVLERLARGPADEGTEAQLAVNRARAATRPQTTGQSQPNEWAAGVPSPPPAVAE